jgi:hypothetical protein
LNSSFIRSAFYAWTFGKQSKGSQQFGMVKAITQLLAGRVSLLELWPFSLAELQAVGRAPASLDALLHGVFFRRFMIGMWILMHGSKATSQPIWSVMFVCP